MVDSKYPQDMAFEFLDTNGDGTGDTNANGNYSVTPEAFYYQPSENVEIARLIIHIEDTSGGSAEDYGNITGGLTNGYSILVQDESQNTLLDLTSGIAITSNGSIGRYCYDVRPESTGAGNEFWQARWTFAKAGRPLFIEKDHRLSITFNDDLSGLIEHYFMLQGVNK